MVEDGNAYFDSRENCNAIINKSNTLLYGCKNTVIPNSVTAIGSNAFAYHDQLESINLPEGLTSIGALAFQGCSSLKSIQFPKSLRTIGASSFWGCSSLTSVEFPVGIAAIGNMAFVDCTGLTSVISHITEPFTTSSSTFMMRTGGNYLVQTSATLYVPYGCKEKYETTDYWRYFKTIVEMDKTDDDGLIPINSKTFPNEKFRQWVYDNSDKDKDGCLSEEEIAATKTIFSGTYNTTIDDLTGIEYFTALETLNLLRTRVVSLDLSNNTALKTLKCSQDTYLESLDISKNTALEYVDVSNTKLTSLDASNLPNLRELYCTNCTLLESLNCSNTQLTSLDVTGNTALRELICYGNQIKGDAMDALINSLPTVDNGTFVVIDMSSSATEGNTCSKEQIAAAQAKGWKVMSHTDAGDVEYDGTEAGVKERLQKIQEMEEYLMYQLRQTRQELEEKATESEEPELYQRVQEMSQYLDYLRYKTSSVTTMQEVTELEAMIAEIQARLYQLQEDVKNFTPNTPLTPMENGDNVNIGNEINSDTNLDGNVVGNILYNISSGNGEFNPEEGCIVVSKPVSDETMSNLEGKDIFGEDFKDQYTGIVFKVAEGSGKVKVEAQTTGNMVLKVKIGNGDPIEMELDGKLKISFPYSVSEETLVYIYGSTKAAQAKRMGKGVTNTESGTLKIFGIEITKDGTGIQDMIRDDQPQDVYTLSGQKVRSQAKDLNGLPAGVYIVGGKKVVVK